MSAQTSPLAPKNYASLPALKALALATTHAGIREGQGDDVLLVTFPAGTEVAGVYTRSLAAAAPGEWSRSASSSARVRSPIHSICAEQA